MKDGVELVLNCSSSMKRRRLWGRVKEEKRQEFIDALVGHDSLRTLVLYLEESVEEGTQVEENDVDNLTKRTPRLRVVGFQPS